MFGNEISPIYHIKKKLSPTILIHSLDHPVPFEDIKRFTMKTLRMEEMNWVDIKKAINDGFKTVIIGVVSTEQHGPHLPTQTDALIADVIVNLIAQNLKNALQAQTIRVGCSDHHLSFPGTISLRKSTLKALIHDYAESLQKHGFENIIFIGMVYNLKILDTERELLNKVEIIKIENMETLKVWNDIILTGFAFPEEIQSDFFYNAFSFKLLNDRTSASAFLAYYDGNPIASSLVLYEAGVAGIHMVTTLEEARSKGIGTAITLAPLNEAKKIGYETAILHSTEMGLNMYKQMGFKEYCTIEVFIWQPGSKE